jgi:hypothetical protein
MGVKKDDISLPFTVITNKEHCLDFNFFRSMSVMMVETVHKNKRERKRREWRGMHVAGTQRIKKKILW